jgi:hypothetical protein
VLDGLFHEAVVICEGDGDCRFYEAILDDLYQEAREAGLPVRRPQVLFTHSGGKSRLPVLAQALRDVQVPTAVITDFDIFKQLRDLNGILRGLGFPDDDADLQRKAAAVKAHMDNTSRKPSREYIRSRVVEMLDESSESRLTSPELSRLKALLNSDSDWEQTSRTGVGYFVGTQRTQVEHLIAALAEWRTHIVPVGQLEGFVPEVGGHGPKWVSGVFEKRLHLDRLKTAPRDFLRQVLRSVDINLPPVPK